jgi:integrase
VRVQKAGRRRDIGLGSATKVSLSEARRRAELVRSQMEAGLDPVAERKKAGGMPTFKEAAALVFAASKRTCRNTKHQWQWMRTLEMFAFPAIGDMKGSEITASQVRDLLAVIWLEKPETARRVRQRAGMILDWAHSKGYRAAEAPMRAISKGLPRQPRATQHYAAMPYSDVPAFLPWLHERETWGRLALRAAILTAARSAEVRLATWDELDLEAGLWSIPAARMKSGRPHVVPLSPAAKRVFERAAVMRTAGAKFVFHGLRSEKPMSDMTLTKCLREMGEKVTTQGFRSSFRDWVSEETNFPGELAEAALAHSVRDKTEAAYRRGNLLEKRRALMDAWGADAVHSCVSERHWPRLARRLVARAQRMLDLPLLLEEPSLSENASIQKTLRRIERMIVAGKAPCVFLRGRYRHYSVISG